MPFTTNVSEPLLKPRSTRGRVTPLKSIDPRDLDRFIQAVNHPQSVFTMIGILLFVLSLIGLRYALIFREDPLSILFCLQFYLASLFFMEICIAPRCRDFKQRLVEDKAGDFWRFHWNAFGKEFLNQNKNVSRKTSIR